MTALRATILTVGVATLGLGATPAEAQVSEDIVLNILRECSKIGDATARLACYDNNIRANGGTTPVVQSRRPTSGAPVSSTVGAGVAAGSATAVATGFGAESIRSADRFETPAGQVEQIQSRIVSARERQPGMFVVTLEDGAEWAFTEGAPRSYRPPENGDAVQIERASMGSFLMRVDNQAPMKVRRTR